jgi:hypothetical protein
MVNPPIAEFSVGVGGFRTTLGRADGAYGVSVVRKVAHDEAVCAHEASFAGLPYAGAETAPP